MPARAREPRCSTPGATLHGRKAAALGDIATLSFYPSKNLGCFGDGGAVITDDDELERLVKEKKRELRRKSE